MKSVNRIKLKYVADYIQRGDAPTYVDSNGVSVINQACVQPSGVDLLKMKLHDPEDLGRITSWLQQDDVLINSTGTGTLGRVAHVREEPTLPMFADGHVTIIRDSAQRFEPRYLFYVLSVQQEQITVECAEGATNQIELSRHRLGNKYIDWPSIESQRQLVFYLDQHTGNLNKLIIEKQRLLDLLAEKRRALIVRYITQGLKPKAPLRDSGVPFLGEVPARWDVWRIGHFATVGNGSTPFRDNLDYWIAGTIPWLNSAATNEAEITQAKQFVTPTAVAECHLPMVPAGSVLVAITGQGKTRGQAALLTFPAAINQHIAYITPDTSVVNAIFLRLWFVAQYDFLRAMSDDMGGTKGALSCEQITNLRIAAPPIAEQRAIAAHIQTETKKIDNFSKTTERTIALLQERRSALISAAVTGQLTKEAIHAGA